MKVTLDTIFGEVTEEYPETERVLKKYLGEAYCLTCPGKMFDTIGNGAMIHGLSDEEAMNMVHDLQEVVDTYEDGGVKEKSDEERSTKQGDDSADQNDAEKKDAWTALDFQAAFGKDPETGIDMNADDELDPNDPDEGGSPLW